MHTRAGGSAAKAHCVSALKAMARDLTHGQTITETLDACDWWGMYKEQRHDLFITNSSVAGYLTGPTVQSPVPRAMCIAV